LAVALPVLVVVFVGAIDFARVFYTSMALTNAARAGVQYGAHDAIRSADTVGMKSTAESATGVGGITAVPTRTCQCATEGGTIPFSDTSPLNTCSPTACSGLSGTHLVVTVSVTTSKTFTTIMSGVPGIPGSVSLSRTATMRVMQ
jgi:Flp pilus assembly protein TadG